MTYKLLRRLLERVGVEHVPASQTEEFIFTHCKPYLDQIEDLSVALFRGVKHLPSSDSAYIITVRQNRRPTDSTSTGHGTLIRAIADSGRVASRDNSIFATGNLGVARSYASKADDNLVVAVFPIGEFNYTWHTDASDWMQDKPFRSFDFRTYPRECPFEDGAEMGGMDLCELWSKCSQQDTAGGDLENIISLVRSVVRAPTPASKLRYAFSVLQIANHYSKMNLHGTLLDRLSATDPVGKLPQHEAAALWDTTFPKRVHEVFNDLVNRRVFDHGQNPMTVMRSLNVDNLNADEKTALIANAERVNEAAKGAVLELQNAGAGRVDLERTMYNMCDLIMQEHSHTDPAEVVFGRLTRMLKPDVVGFSQEHHQDSYQQFVDEIKGDDGTLFDAIRSGHEVMIHCDRYLAVPYPLFRELTDHPE